MSFENTESSQNTESDDSNSESNSNSELNNQEEFTNSIETPPPTTTTTPPTIPPTTPPTTIICKSNSGKIMYLIFHMIMTFIALYLSWKCNGGKFDLLGFLLALIVPYFYIIYILGFRGTCALEFTKAVEEAAKTAAKADP